MRTPGTADSARSFDESSSPRPESIRLLVGTRRDWYAAALRTLLEAEGFRIDVARDHPRLTEAASEWSPHLILLDHEMAGNDTVDTCRELYASALSWRIPLIVSAPGPLSESQKAGLFAAGAWLVLTEPLFFGSLLAQLRRLAELAYASDSRADGVAGEGVQPGFLEEAWSRFGLVVSLAERRGEPLACVVTGPTALDQGASLDSQRELTERLCSRSLRSSDVYAWSDGSDVVILAYGASEDGAVALAERLNQAARALSDSPAEAPPLLSAGIHVVLRSEQPATTVESTTGMVVDRVRGESLALARAALRAAREAGGGIRIARTG